MPIRFRCDSCRTRLSVPGRWSGKSIDCPRCEARVTVPDAEAPIVAGTLEGDQVERSLEALDVPAEEAFSFVPRAGESGVSGPRRSPRRKGAAERRRAPIGKVRATRTVTLPAWVPYAFPVAIVVVAAVAFVLGVWWGSTGQR